MVCRAVEDSPGPVVEQQFGEFQTWTQAQAFASKLNEGLGLDSLEVRQIVTNSLLASACVVQEALHFRRRQLASAAVIQTRATQLQFLLAELALAITFCRVATIVGGGRVRRMLLQARQALQHSTDFLLKNSDGDDSELAAMAETLDASLRAFPLPSRTSPDDAVPPSA